MASTSPPRSRDYHNLEVQEVVESLNTNLDTGLSESEAKSRLSKHGYNYVKITEEANLFREIKDYLFDAPIILFCIVVLVSFIVSLFK